jgi:hypothetical protein
VRIHSLVPLKAGNPAGRHTFGFPRVVLRQVGCTTTYPKIGKEATLGILSAGEFFGEGGLAGEPLRMGSATAMTDC